MIVDIKELSTMEIIQVMDELENSPIKYKSINHYMVKKYGIDYDKTSLGREIENVLNATMVNINGYWMVK